ncbi:hypothetical protein Peur_031858 [Populus x canadensis]
MMVVIGFGKRQSDLVSCRGKKDEVWWGKGLEKSAGFSVFLGWRKIGCRLLISQLTSDSGKPWSWVVLTVLNNDYGLYEGRKVVMVRVWLWRFSVVGLGSMEEKVVIEFKAGMKVLDLWPWRM